MVESADYAGEELEGHISCRYAAKKHRLECAHLPHVPRRSRRGQEERYDGVFANDFLVVDSKETSGERDVLVVCRMLELPFLLRRESGGHSRGSEERRSGKALLTSRPCFKR